MRPLLLLAPLLSALAFAPAAAAQNPWLAERVLNIAHQAGEDEFPSNTSSPRTRCTRSSAR